MTAPEPFTVSVSDDTITDNSDTADYGPDSTHTPRETNQRNTKRNTKLGQNRKRASGIRQLTEKDKSKIGDLYRTSALMLMPFKPSAANIIVESADTCADAWFHLAAENDNVRRIILAMIEGSAWGGVLTAHMPIFMAVIPMDRLPLAFQSFTTDTPDDASSLYQDGE